MLTADEILSILAKPVDTDLVRTRVESGKTFTYIPIEHTIATFNDYLGLNWNWVIGSYDLQEHPDRTKSGKAQFVGVVSGTIEVYNPEDPETLLAARFGVGAGTMQDPDGAIKTAEAEAFKKAAHYFNFGLYLSHAAERYRVEVLQSGSTPAMQGYLTDNAIANGVDENPQDIAEYYGVSTTAMRDPVILKSLVEGV